MQIPKMCVNDFSQGMEVWKNLNHVKCGYRIIGRLISIEVLWKLFYPNTSTKDKL